MLISIKHRFVFVANLKTASTAIENQLKYVSDIRLLQTRYGKHIPLAKIHRILEPLDEVREIDFFTFGVMREPLSYLISIYNSHTKPDFDGTSQTTGDMTFSEFIDEWCVKQQGWQVQPQKRRFVDQAGQIGLDYICDFDNLFEDMKFVSAKVGLNIKLAVENTSPVVVKASQIDNHTKRKVFELYEEDYRLYRQLTQLNQTFRQTSKEFNDSRTSNDC